MGQHLKKMESGIAVQTAADLHLFLLDRALHPELFRQYGSYRVSQERYHADIWFTGVSHVVTVTDGQRTLTERGGEERDLLAGHGIVTRWRGKG